VGLTATVAKTSAGASTHVMIAQVTNLNYAIDELKERNVWLVGADQNAEQVYYEADLSGALGIVIGAEGSGLHRLVKEKCDFLIKIPMYGKLNSLNVSVAAALIFFEARRQRESQFRKSKF
jgi:23S rRNA (guanosine2251-2'-O)-methyltransferase